MNAIPVIILSVAVVLGALTNKRQNDRIDQLEDAIAAIPLRL